MANRQIQPVRTRDYAITRQARPRGLLSQFWTVALQPNYFFKTLPSAADTRQWFWAAVLILALVGFSAVRQDAVVNSGSSGGGSSLPPDFGGSLPGTDLGGGGVSSGFPGSGTPSDLGGGGFPTDSSSSGGTEDVSNTLITALIAASYIVLGWFIVSFLLCEVSLFNGTRPQVGQNFQIAIWTTVPLAIMAGLQIVYYSAGGKVGAAGLAGLVSQWKAYENLPVFTKSLVLSLATHLTLFWIWSLFLLYRGARGALNGKRWAVMIVVVAWAVIVVVTPVITGTISAAPPAESEGTTDTLTGDQSGFPFDGTGFNDPSTGVDQLVDPSGTLPPELDFLNDDLSGTPTGEAEIVPDVTEEPTETQAQSSSQSQSIPPGGGKPISPKVTPASEASS